MSWPTIAIATVLATACGADSARHAVIKPSLPVLPSHCQVRANGPLVATVGGRPDATMNEARIATRAFRRAFFEEVLPTSPDARLATLAPCMRGDQSYTVSRLGAAEWLREWVTGHGQESVLFGPTSGWEHERDALLVVFHGSSTQLPPMPPGTLMPAGLIGPDGYVLMVFLAPEG